MLELTALSTNLVCMPKSFSVRKLEATDATNSVAKQISSLITQLSEREIHLSVEEVRTIARANYFVVAEVQDSAERSIVGIACLVVMHLPQGLRFLLESFVVDQRFRERGIGAALIDAVLAEAGRQDDTGHVSLTCNHKRIDSQNFYADLGFNKAETSVLRRPVTRPAHHP